MNDIKKTVLSKFVVQTPTLETNEINTNSLTLAGQSLEEFIEQNMGGAEAIEQLQSKVGTLETSVGEINGEIEELSSKSYAYTDSDNTFSGQNSFDTIASVQSLNATEAYIENLTIKELTVLDDEASGVSVISETYENTENKEVILNFDDEHNGKYAIIDNSNLEISEGCKILNVHFQIPSELGNKLVCRYLVLDFRNESEETNIATVWDNSDSIKWTSEMPDFQGGYFYVIDFQRFAKDLIVGNVRIKLGGE